MGPEIRPSAASGPRAPSATRRGSRLAAVGSLALAAGLSACALNQEGVPPPRDDMFFPAGAKLDATGQWLYVTNSNSDLRYNDGTLVVVNLNKARDDRAKSGWSPCPQVNYIRPANAPTSTPLCCWDALDRYALNCDSRQYIDPGASVRIGSFAGEMVFHAETTCLDSRMAHCDGRLFVAVRGNSSITSIDVALPDGAEPQLSCSVAGPGAFDACDQDHVITQRPLLETTEGAPIPIPDAAQVTLPEEPYAMALNVDKNHDWLMVGHLRGGAISLIDVGMAVPRLIGFYNNLVPPDGSGQRGITSMIAGPSQGSFYVGSRFVPRVAGIVTTGEVSNPFNPEALDNVVVVGNGLQYVSSLSGTETRGIAFIEAASDDPAPQPGLAFVLQRVPPVLLKFEGANQLPVDVLETCNSPTFLYQNGEDVNARLYVNCFEDGEVYVFDPRVPRLVDVIEVGRGPAGLEFPPKGAADYGKLMYVVGFGANNVSVVDIEAGSPTENHVIQRIGFPSAVPR